MSVLVSVIIPTYNRAHLIGETLDSVLAQTYCNWECIVVDDGSNDNTNEVMEDYCKKDKRFKYHHRPKSKLNGGNSARNYGFKLSKGTFIQFLDSDDLIVSNKLSFQIENIIKLNKKGAICNASFFDKQIGDINPQEYWTKNVEDENVLEKLFSQHMRWSSLSGIWKRELLEIINWDENITRGQEWLFHIKLMLLINQEAIFFSNNSLGWVRKTTISKTLGDSLGIRHEGYLNARISLLNYLLESKNEKSEDYFKLLYGPTIKYIRVLLRSNYFKVIKNFSLLIKKISFKRYLLFIMGCLFYKLLKINFFLKKVKY